MKRHLEFVRHSFRSQAPQPLAVYRTLTHILAAGGRPTTSHGARRPYRTSTGSRISSTASRTSARGAICSRC